MKTLLLSAGMLVLLGCGTKKTTVDTSAQDTAAKSPETVVATISKVRAKSHPTNILGAHIDGNTLVLDVSYRGGCQEHFFDLVGSEAISKSLPPRRSVQLVHTGEPDVCEAMIAKTLSFDLRKLACKQEAGSEIILKLDGWKEDLRYVYE